jgi:uncharacterized membrane protein YccC
VEAGRAGVSKRSEASLGRHIGRTTRQIDRNTKQLREDSEAIRKRLASIAREPDAPLLSPWTLANERVWNDTHRFAAKTFVAGGLLGLILTIIGLHRWPVIALLVGGLAPVVYSFVFYKQLERRGEL